MALLASFLVGALWFIVWRVATLPNKQVHYHANFAIFVEGQPLKLDGPTFYEEVTSCGLDGDNDPKRRVHLHDNIADVVHVHDLGATWGHLFANLRFGLTDSSLTLDDGTKISGTEGKSLNFILNGETVSAVANKPINSGDKLLVSYGTQSKDELMLQYASIADTAEEFNTKADPSTCAAGGQLTLSERFRQALSLE